MSDAHGSHDEKQKPGFFSNAVAVVAFIIVMAIVIWGLLHLLNLSTAWFASTFSPARSSSATVIPTATPTPLPTVVQNTQASYTSAPAPTPIDAAPAYRGPADLAVRIVSVNTGNPASVSFDIANVGGSSSGTYTFTAYLPTAQGYVYTSPLQYSLNPGDHIVNTLQFSQGTSGTITVVLHASDASFANNTASQSFVGSYEYPQLQYQYQPYDYYDYQYTYPYDYNYDYYSQPQYLY